MITERRLAMTLAVLTPALVVASPAIAQRAAGPATTASHLDARTGAKLASSSNGRISVSQLLRDAGTVELRGTSSMPLVLHVFRMRGGNVLESYQSRPVNVPAGERLSLARFLQPGSPQYGNLALEPEFVVEAVRMVPAGMAIADPGRFVINGVIPYHPKNWESMEAIYAVAVPADERQLETATAGFAGVFAPTER